MRLLHYDQGGKLALSEFVGNSTPPYVILSHTWGPDATEVTFRDLAGGPQQYEYKFGFQKIRFCMAAASKIGLSYIWG